MMQQPPYTDPPLLVSTSYFLGRARLVFDERGQVNLALDLDAGTFELSRDELLGLFDLAQLLVIPRVVAAIESAIAVADQAALGRARTNT